jgi:hypothetical protein
MLDSVELSECLSFQKVLSTKFPGFVAITLAIQFQLGVKICRHARE